jgi:hypothetical protein
MPKKETEYTCTAIFTEGWQERLTQAFVELYYDRLKRGLPVTEEQGQENFKDCPPFPMNKKQSKGND